jgi:hypothetical protein
MMMVRELGSQVVLATVLAFVALELERVALDTCLASIVLIVLDGQPGLNPLPGREDLFSTSVPGGGIQVGIAGRTEDG